MKDRFRGYGNRSFASEDPIEGFPVSLNFLFRAVARPGFAKNQGAQTIWRDRDPLDPVRGLGALDDGLLAKSLEDFRLLTYPEILLALGFHAIGQEPRR